MTPERARLIDEQSYLLNDSKGLVVQDEESTTNSNKNLKTKILITFAVVTAFVASVLMVMSSPSTQRKMSFQIMSLQLSAKRGQYTIDADTVSVPTLLPTHTAGPTAKGFTFPTFGPTHTAGPTADADIVVPPISVPAPAPDAPISVLETSHPTVDKTYSPTVDKTSSPTIDRTPSPTLDATPSPTTDKTSAPSADETSSPTEEVTDAPTDTSEPSSSPTHSVSPTVSGFVAPTFEPTHPTDVSLVDTPTQEPSAVPTHTVSPSSAPSEEEPTAAPSHSISPTVNGFVAPTFVPTHPTDVSVADSPTQEPSAVPTHTAPPTTISELTLSIAHHEGEAALTAAPLEELVHRDGEAVLSAAPSEEAARIPQLSTFEFTASFESTFGPTHTIQPTSVPTHTVQPTSVPTHTVAPTSVPTHTVDPTSVPTHSVQPTSLPTVPTAIPTHTVQPTYMPTHTVQPTGTPVSYTAHNEGEAALTGAPVEEELAHHDGEAALTAAPSEESQLSSWNFANLLPGTFSSSATFSNQNTVAPTEEITSAMDASLKTALTSEPTEEAKSWNFGNLLPGSASSFATVASREVDSAESYTIATAARTHVRRGYVEKK